MPSSVRNLVSRAHRLLGVVESGNALPEAVYQDGLFAFNAMIEAWATEKLTVYQMSRDIIPLVSGQSDYTIGDSASYDVNSVRPMNVTSAFVRLSDVDYPVRILTRDQYDSIALKSLQSSIPESLYYDTGYPFGTINVWCVPSAAITLYLDSVKPFSGFDLLSDVVTFPPGYERALTMNLAVELMPEFNVNNPRIDALAKKAKTTLKRTNVSVPVLNLPAEVLNYGRGGSLAAFLGGV